MARPEPPELAPVPEDLRVLVAGVCARLPEAECLDNGVGYVLRLRKRSFGTIFAVVPPSSGTPQPMLVVLADPEERRAVLAMGHPYFRPNTLGSRIGVVLDGTVEPAEIAELITEAYRQVAPKKLIGQLPGG